MIYLFWFSFMGVFYAYFGYPLLLLMLGKIKDLFKPKTMELLSENQAPSITIIIPAYNEEKVIKNKIENTLNLYYPGELQILFVSDGSTDLTVSYINEYTDNVQLLDLKKRQGKAQAMNLALKEASGEIIVFTDASIMLEKDSVWNIIQPFADSAIGCISGEDHIDGEGSEGLYGKYELFLRNQESRLGSIVGASGSFYAQRKELVFPFLEGLAPDFLSVMNTVEKGYRVITYPLAKGVMTALKSNQDEFNRKVRTLIRGMTALFKKTNLLNPMRYPLFSLFLISHKLFRWIVPFFLITLFFSNLYLLDYVFFILTIMLQVIFYLLAVLGNVGNKKVMESVIGKIAVYFTNVNVAIFVAWFRYLVGVRQELWVPTKRS